MIVIFQMLVLFLDKFFKPPWQKEVREIACEVLEVFLEAEID